MFSWGELFSTFLVRKIMGVEGSCRSANGGGVSPFVCSSAAPFLLLSSLPFLLHRVKFSDEQGKKWQKLDFIWCGLVFSRDFGRPKRAKIKHILESGRNEGARWWAFVPEFHRVHLWQVVGSLWLVLCFRGVFSSSGRVFPSVCLLCRLVVGALPLKYAFIRILRAFLRGFSCSVWVCVGWVVCLACVGFVRVNS